MFRQAKEIDRPQGHVHRQGRRQVLGVVVCLGPVSESTIVDRCHRYYGMSAFEVSQRLLELFTAQVVETIGSDDLGQPRWELADANLRAEIREPKA